MISSKITKKSKPTFYLPKARQVFKYIPNGITLRLSTNFSYINIFTQSKHNHELALKNSGYPTKLDYITTDETSNVFGREKNWSKKILWFTLPYDMAIAINYSLKKTREIIL